MNTEQHLLDVHLEKLRKLSYEELVAHISQEAITDELKNDQGTPYQLDIRFFYDDKELRTVRVHGSLYAIQPITPWWKFWKKIDSPVATSDFIVGPDGTFVDE